MGQNKHILQCKHRPKGEYLSVHLSVCFKYKNSILKNDLHYRNEVFTCVKDGNKMIRIKSYLIEFQNGTFKNLCVKFHKQQWLNENICKCKMYCKCYD